MTVAVYRGCTSVRRSHLTEMDTHVHVVAVVLFESSHYINNRQPIN